LIDVNPHLKDAIKKESIEAKQMPSKLSEFRIKRLNRPASTADGWIDLQKWKECGGTVDIDKLKQHPCFGGLDLASTGDITSFRIAWEVDRIIYTTGIRWVPESAVAYRTERGTVPYAAWVEMGLLKQTAGNVTDYDVIEADIKGILAGLNIEIIAYDRWNATDLVNRLVKDGLPMVEFIQGPKSYHPAMQALEHCYMAGRLAHNDDQVLQWCASNVVARRDVNLNMAPDKKNSADKIDDMTALLMAVGVMKTGEIEPEKEYEMFFV
jgi:phage terminase large subunit-like protein